jgi:hypothetical protein
MKSINASLMSIKYSILILFVVLLAASCNKTDIDDEKPIIDMGYAEAFPKNCDTLYFGETFVVKAVLSDNVTLGSYRVDIHNNFDHHSHSTDFVQCEMAPVKNPVNPYLLIGSYDIPEGSQNYEVSLELLIPHGNEAGVFDEGDYHFFISLTDREGWSTQKGIAVKIFYR